MHKNSTYLENLFISAVVNQHASCTCIEITCKLAKACIRVRGRGKRIPSSETTLYRPWRCKCRPWSPFAVSCLKDGRRRGKEDWRTDGSSCADGCCYLWCHWMPEKERKNGMKSRRVQYTRMDFTQEFSPYIVFSSLQIFKYEKNPNPYLML